jgi:hypothetical protein
MREVNGVANEAAQMGGWQGLPYQVALGGSCYMVTLPRSPRIDRRLTERVRPNSSLEAPDLLSRR